MNPYPLNQILVVEDDTAVQRQLLQLLKANDYSATAVGSIAETLAIPDLDEYQTILLDWHLPDGTAQDLLPKIKMRAPGAASIVVTGDADIHASIAALRHGAVDYLIKPIQPNCLQASLARIERLRDSQRRTSQCERLAAIGQAVASVAHESRNALQRILARAELMELDLASDHEKCADLGVIKSASLSLQCMFEELREFAGPIAIQKQNCQLGEIIKQAWLSLSAARLAKQTTLNCRFDDITFSVDPVRMEQVFRNLFENAIAACPSPAIIDVSWHLACKFERKLFQIVVRDNGPGLSAEQRERAFEPFYTTKSKGTGLGLPICNRILEQHHGWLEIGNNTQTGGCFAIVLPFENIHKHATKSIQPRRAHESKKTLT